MCTGVIGRSPGLYIYIIDIVWDQSRAMQEDVDRYEKRRLLPREVGGEKQDAVKESIELKHQVSPTSGGSSRADCGRTSGDGRDWR